MRAQEKHKEVILKGINKLQMLNNRRMHNISSLDYSINNNPYMMSDFVNKRPASSLASVTNQNNSMISPYMVNQ